MSHILTDLGEEWTIKNDISSLTVTVGLYNDADDAISDTDDLAALASEPTDGNYARQSVTLTADDDGDWHVQNSAQITFDVTSTTGTVDSWFIMYNFTAVDTSDGGGTDHLIATGALSQSRDLSQIDTLNVSSGTVGIKYT